MSLQDHKTDAGSDHVNTPAYAAMFLVAVWSIISRLLGLVRDQVIGVRFGVGPDLDAYTLGITAPQALTTLMTAPLSAAVLPILAQRIERDGEQAGVFFAKRLLVLAFLFATAVGVLGVCLSSQILNVMIPGIETSGIWDVARASAVWGFASVPFLVAAVVLKADLDRRGLYGTSAIQPVILNSAVIILLFFQRNPSASLISFGLAVGAFLHVLWQFRTVWPLWSESQPYPLMSDWMKLLRLAGPVVIGSVISQLNVAVDRRFAYAVAAGSVGALGLADRIRQLPYGIIAISIYTTVFPHIAALAAKRNVVEFRHHLARSLWLMLVGMLPFAVWLLLGAQPIVQIVFERGRFDNSATHLTALALRAYAPGLIGMGLSQVLMGAHYANNDTGKALIISGLANVLNMLLDPLFATAWGHTGIALAHTIAVSLQTLALWLALPSDCRPSLAARKIMPVAAAASISATVLVLGRYLTPPYPGLGHVLYWFLVFALGFAGYFFALVITGVSEATEIVHLVMAKIRAVKR